MGHRFFAEHPIVSDHTTLAGAEAHHLIHVLRAEVGNEITVFDGSGKEFTARIEHMTRSEVGLILTSTKEVSREAARQMIVGVAFPKGDRQRWLIEKLTELGVTRVVPLQSERSVVHPERRSLKKFGRFVIEASKQCGRNRLMEIAPLTSLRDFLSSAPPDALRWVADPSGNPAGSRPVDAATTACFAVGPEGGFSPQERRAAKQAGWQCVSLGPRVLRIETACTVLVTLVSSDLRQVW